MGGLGINSANGDMVEVIVCRLVIYSDNGIKAGGSMGRQVVDSVNGEILGDSVDVLVMSSVD